MAPFTCSKGVTPQLELPPQGNTKKSPAISAELLPIQTKNNTDLLGDLESPLTSFMSLLPDNSARGLGPLSIDEKGLSLWPVKEESIVSDDADLPGDQGSHDNVNEPISTGFVTMLDDDLLDLQDESVVLHPDDVKGWETVGKNKGRCTPSPDPGSKSARFVASMKNRFDVLSDPVVDENKVTIEKTVKFVHDARQKNFENQLGDLFDRFLKDCEQNHATKVDDEDMSDGSETETSEPPPPKVNKGKFQDFHDTGIPGIDNKDLDPEIYTMLGKTLIS
ncbi:hypothetical protein ARMGADRAFT_1086972 [Armillaria gallica]|uniref:Uncharacterized protein n=1 Tax=Armillaria gallica TaxID=47427 RepID=A0A2H3CVR6_ARMGA|nr:hypothetical protein ARMGADRAFT_1086972 [Armillaria gallica]